MIAELLSRLRSQPGNDSAFNQWRDYDPELDCGPDAPLRRTRNLEQYIDARLGQVKLIACAEATGYQGGRFTGIPMTSERILMGYCEGTKASDVFPPDSAAGDMSLRTSRVDALQHPRISTATREHGFAEPTASYVWRTIRESGADPYFVLLWNTYPFHARLPDRPLSNRRLLTGDVQVGRPFVTSILSLCPGARVVAIGNWAGATLTSVGVEHLKVRHPSQGGAPRFRKEFLEVLALTKSKS